MMFLSNKYSRWYYSIITAAQLREVEGYTEKHHIIPHSLGGTRAKANLVRLTAREHFICHQLLTRFTEGNARVKMLRAIWSMTRANKKSGRVLTSKQHEIARKACAEAASLYRHTEESKRKISEALTGKPKSETHRQNTSISSKGRTWKACESKNPNFGKGSNNANSKDWVIIDSNGTHIHTNCLKIWCEENSISYGGLRRAKNPYKGFTLQRV